MSGEPVTRVRHGAEASPFQTPTRLADGLGLESGLGGLHLPFAPSSAFAEEFGSPASCFRKEADLGW